ncbi:MAG: hypothetical protein WAS23_05105 [Dokdonella sp.]|uniref:hypothetical protein n=1 Tax=Dokdonella sp. TaxID=2291710 RepID=UPI002B9207D1|nr:hypothetical protein [Dokdonella sp.]HOX70455.1 hypothetical protein [Dokdonella sp.]HPG94219.1 hypothetical protein [Dokdonella sp.]HPN79223.1 hypothetical protein [Dokdonella sp.]
MFRAITLVALALVLFASPLAAKKPEEKAVAAVSADTAEKFAVVVERIRSQMAPGKRYEFLSTADRESVNLSFDKMSAMLTASGSVGAMPEDDRLRLFNEQEKVNGLLAKNADDRLICTHVAPVGSHLPVKQCRTAREVADSRSKARRQSESFDSTRLNRERSN